MLPGINEDIVRGARTYHLQTEDRGERNPEVISVLFLGGAVLTTERKSYKAILEHPERVRGVKKLMIWQHRDVLRRILEGEFDEFEVARRSMTEIEPLLLAPDSVPDLDIEVAAAVALAEAEVAAANEAGAGPGSGDQAGTGAERGSTGDSEETVVPGQDGEDLAAARDAAQNQLDAEAQAVLMPLGGEEETVDVVPDLADPWGSDETWPATGFGHEVITERPFDLVIALELQAMDDASPDRDRQ